VPDEIRKTRNIPATQPNPQETGPAESTGSRTARTNHQLGLARAVLDWRRPDGLGFEVFARTAIAAQLSRLPTANPGEP